MSKKDVFILGARPTVIKLASLIKKTNGFVIHTGQHRDLAEDMYKTFDIKPDINLDLMTEDQTLASFTTKCVMELDKIFKEHKFERVWVHGYTSSCLAGALAAVFNRIPLVHNEAGLRTGDVNNPYPEEYFRTTVDSMADILFASTKRAVKNLKNGDIHGKVYLVGNTVIDALKISELKLPKERPTEEKYVLATVHRRESFGNDLLEIFKALKELSKSIKIILPAHPNPNVQKVIKEVGLEVVEPMNYVDFLWHLRDCEYVVSDSGGVQEEAPSFNKKIIVLRKTTERQEVIEKGYGILIPEITKENILNKIAKFTKKINVKMKNPFGDGKSADKILDILNMK